MPAKEATNPYAHLEPHPSLIHSDVSNNKRWDIEEAISHIHQLTGVPKPVTGAEIIDKALQEATDTDAYLEKFDSALIAGDAKTALEHFSKAIAASNLASSPEGVSQVKQVRAQVHERDVKTQFAYIRDNIDAARKKFNQEAKTFTEAFDKHLDGLVLSVDTITATDARARAYATCRAAANTLNTGIMLVNLIPSIFSYTRPSKSHLFTKGKALPATTQEENYRYVYVRPDERVPGEPRPKVHGVPITPQDLENIAKIARLTGGAARPGESIRLHWGTPQELQKEHDEFEQMEDALAEYIITAPIAQTYWDKKAKK
ncbi:hypothetical protein [Rothia nasimurium]|uniref:hypothetical protein n=1 Tax=Rothia nasimurium TaxID=85336 RepID=UPI001F3CEB9E|nr:hypothetical protein [Rothia nasimurium]